MNAYTREEPCQIDTHTNPLSHTVAILFAYLCARSARPKSENGIEGDSTDGACCIKSTYTRTYLYICWYTPKNVVRGLYTRVLVLCL